MVLKLRIMSYLCLVHVAEDSSSMTSGCLWCALCDASLGKLALLVSHLCRSMTQCMRQRLGLRLSMSNLGGMSKDED
eukprot:1988064-Amphidinium_carterae.1